MSAQQDAGYDVIVIGAGSAGAVVASRLTEDEGRRVLLLESGPDYRSADALPEIQSIEPGMMRVTETLSATHTYPNLLGRRTPVQDPWVYFRGRGIGGSSSINGLFAIRAAVEDYDGWAAQGAKGWAYDEILPLLNKLENDQDFGDKPYHGNAGPIPITRPRREDFCAIDAAVDQITERLGHPWAPDHNAPGSTGASPFALNGINGRRVSTNDGYLEPARDRPGLRILGNAHVDRILFSGNRAVGVRAIVDGEITEFRAAEVVVSGGVIHSPAILQRSGIGPAALLRGLGIDVVADLPVGRGLQEHPSLAMGVILNEPLDYRGCPQRGQISVRFSTGVDNEPNDAMIAIVGALGLGLPVSGIIGWGNRVTSEGSVELTSTDPMVDPFIDFNLLSTPEDMRRYRAIYDELQSWAAQPELQNLAAMMTFGTGMIPHDTKMSDSEFSEWALANVGDTVHGAGTCRMGEPGDPRVVVDPEGRVLGLEGLRVADMSIVPWTTRGNTNLTAILVGEKIADCMRGGIGP